MAETLHESGAIRIIPAFLPESAALYDQLLNAVAWDARIRARKAASFGLPYNYSGIDWPASPMPPFLAPMADKVSQIVGFEPNNCLAHYYPDGRSNMGFHSDSASELVPHTGIVVLSLGTERSITFRRTRDKSRTESHALPAGSLLWMSLEMQSEWQHAILLDGNTSGGRISLTFRRLRPGTQPQEPSNA